MNKQDILIARIKAAMAAKILSHQYPRPGMRMPKRSTLWPRRRGTRGTWQRQLTPARYKAGAILELERQLAFARTENRRAILRGRIEAWTSGKKTA